MSRASNRNPATYNPMSHFLVLSVPQFFLRRMRTSRGPRCLAHSKCSICINCTPFYWSCAWMSSFSFWNSLIIQRKPCHYKAPTKQNGYNVLTSQLWRNTAKEKKKARHTSILPDTFPHISGNFLAWKQRSSSHLAVWVWAHTGRRGRMVFRGWACGGSQDGWQTSAHSQGFGRSPETLLSPTLLTDRLSHPLRTHKKTTSVTAVPDRKVQTLPWRACFSGSQTQWATVAQTEKRKRNTGSEEGMGGSRPSTKSSWSMGADTFRANCTLAHTWETPNSQRNTKDSPVGGNMCHRNSTNHIFHAYCHQGLYWPSIHWTLRSMATTWPVFL